MDEKELQELQDPETWESGPDDKRQPVKSPRAVVSVAFARSDFELVSESARRSGMKTSEFIREAAIERATKGTPKATVVSVSGSVRTEYPTTRLRGARFRAHVNNEETRNYATV